MKFCVIGLGRFGYQVATVLAENGMEVLAIDNNESIVASIRDSVAHAIVMDVTDEASLRSIGVDEIDTVIVAMGENSTQTILITAILKKHLKTPYVITRAIDDLNKEILTLVGADRVILPEKEIGIRLADNLSSPFVDVTRLTKNFSVINIVAPEEFIDNALNKRIEKAGEDTPNKPNKAARNLPNRATAKPLKTTTTKPVVTFKEKVKNKNQ